MAIGDRIKEAIDKLNQGDPVNALIQVCIAIDGTSKKEFRGKIAKKQSRRYKAFLKEYNSFITGVATGFIALANPIIFQIPDSNNSLTCKTMDEILYHVVRCTLLHEGILPDKVEFTEKNVLGSTADGKMLLSRNLILALILSVVASRANVNERLPEGYSIGTGKTRIDLNNFWGKKDELFKLAWERNKS